MVYTLRASVSDDTVRDMEPTQVYRSAHRVRGVIGPSYQERVKARSLPSQRSSRLAEKTISSFPLCLLAPGVGF